MNDQDFYKLLADEVGETVDFEPMACYNADGDCIEFHVSNENYYAKRVDGWVTLYYSEESGEIVGGMIKGVASNLLRKYPGLRIECRGNSVDLGVLLRVTAYKASDEVIQRTYKDVINRTGSLEVENLAMPC